MRKRLRKIASIVGALLLFMVLAFACIVYVIPAAMHGAALTVYSGSMRPTYEVGDIVAVMGIENDLSDVKVGDVITFMPKPDDPTLVTHRVVELGPTDPITQERSVYTQGDANNVRDAIVKEKQVRGKVMYSFPWLGNLTDSRGWSKPYFVVVAAICLLLYGLWAAIFGTRDRFRYLPKDYTKLDALAYTANSGGIVFDVLNETNTVAPLGIAETAPKQRINPEIDFKQLWEDLVKLSDGNWVDYAYVDDEQSDQVKFSITDDGVAVAKELVNNKR